MGPHGALSARPCKEYDEKGDPSTCGRYRRGKGRRYDWRKVMKVYLNPTHEAADAFWEYWKSNGETHKHGYYESTWGAINAALAVSGVVTDKDIADTKFRPEY